MRESNLLAIAVIGQAVRDIINPIITAPSTMRKNKKEFEIRRNVIKKDAIDFIFSERLNTFIDYYKSELNAEWIRMMTTKCIKKGNTKQFKRIMLVR